MKITKAGQIVGTIFAIIIALVISILTDLNTIHKAIAVIILIIIIILILIFDIIKTKIREYSKRKRIKTIVVEDIKAIKNDGVPTINLHDLDYVINNREKFKKIKDLDILFDYFIKQHKLIAKKAKKVSEQHEKLTTSHLKDIDKILKK